MKVLIPRKIYEPKKTHKDNNTRRWQKIVFVQDILTKNVKAGYVAILALAPKKVHVRVLQVCGDGWYKCETRKGVKI